MHYNVKAVLDTFLGKTWKKYAYLLPMNSLLGGYIKGLGKETGEFSHHVFCGKLDITQKQMDSYVLYNEGQKD